MWKSFQQPISCKTCGKVPLCNVNYDRILKVARTIADLEGCHDVLTHHNRVAHQPHRNHDRPTYLES